MALTLCALAACGRPKNKATAADLDQRCERLGNACGDKNKHDNKIIAECKQAAAKQVEKGCTDKTIATYDCYERELCGGLDKVWTIDDLGVLADRHKKCVAERNAALDCVK
jgi:hypothetical protein